MAEPISISSGIAGLLSLAITVAEKSYQYASSVRSASGTITSYLRELSMLKSILFKLSELTETGDAATRLTGVNTSTGILSAMNISACQRDLASLLAKLQRRSEGSALGALAWPFVEHDIKKHIDMLQRYNRLFHLALSADAYTVGSQTLQEVSALRVESEEEKSSSRRKAIVDWLSPGPYDDTHTAVRSRRQADTGFWFLEEIESWLTNPGPTSIFWCRGIPGAGKTVLMSAVVDHIDAMCQHGSIEGFAYIYFNYKQQGSQTIVSIFSSIIVQLLHQSHAVQMMVEKSFEKNQDGKKKAELDELVNILRNVPMSSSIFLAFDAVDEASQSTRKALMSFLSTVKQDHVFAFATSRPDVDLRPIIQKTRVIDVVAKQSDMETFAKARLENSEDVLEMLNDNADSIIQEVVGVVTAQAEGMFLLVTFQIEYLCQQTSAREVLSALEKLPTDAGAFYLQTLEQIDSQPKSQARLARKVLCWLVLAKSSLTLPELSDALATEADSVALDPLNRRSAAMLVKVCRGLVVVDEQNEIIRLAHLTVHEFLINNLLELAQMKDEIAIACVTCISFDTFKAGPCEGYYDVQIRAKQYPFYSYACAHCAEHLREMNLGKDHSIYEKLVKLAVSKSLSESFLQMLCSGGMGQFWRYYPTDTTPLHIAAYLGDEQVAHLILPRYHSSLELQDSHFDTPLLKAIELGHEAIVNVFLEHGVDTEGSTESALNCAARTGQDGIVRLLLERSMTHGGRRLKEERDLFVAAIVGDLEAVANLIRTGVSLDATDIDGGTALQWASWYGRAAVVSCLLEAGSSIEASDRNGRRAMHEAAERGHAAVLEILLRHGADFAAKDRFGLTPLHRAALADTPVVASTLLVRGADPSVIDDDGDTPLHIAVGMGRVETVRLFLESGVEVKGFQATSVPQYGPVTHQQRVEIERLISEAQQLPSYAEATLVTGLHLKASDCMKVDTL